MRAASVLIPAYNEEQNISALLRRVAEESDPGAWTLDDVIVIASGCTDATVSRARSALDGGRCVQVIEQPRREGKASAINLGLAAARNETVLLISGDVLPAPGAIPAVLRRLEDPLVGVAGGRPVPMNAESAFTGYAAHLMWRLHHAVCESAGDHPKCGEMIAFRKSLDGRAIVPAIPVESAVDEVSIQVLVHAAGLRGAYAGEAIVNNWGPSNVRDWFAQRRRINTGHVIVAREGYRPATMSARTVLGSLWNDHQARRRPLWLAGVVAIEIGARLAGHLDARRGRKHSVWTVATTTKRAIGDEAN